MPAAFEGGILSNESPCLLSSDSCLRRYIDCYKTVRARLLEGRTDEIMGRAMAVHEARVAEGREDDRLADYYAAETLLIEETFQRQIGCTASLLSALRVWHAASVVPSIRLSQGLCRRALGLVPARAMLQLITQAGASTYTANVIIHLYHALMCSISDSHLTQF